jgi:hypothetical protein
VKYKNVTVQSEMLDSDTKQISCMYCHTSKHAMIARQLNHFFPQNPTSNAIAKLLTCSMRLPWITPRLAAVFPPLFLFFGLCHLSGFIDNNLTLCNLLCMAFVQVRQQNVTILCLSFVMTYIVTPRADGAGKPARNIRFLADGCNWMEICANRKDDCTGPWKPVGPLFSMYCTPAIRVQKSHQKKKKVCAANE